MQLSTSEIWKQQKKDTCKSLSQSKRNLHMGIVLLMLNRTGFVNEVLRIASLFGWTSATFYPEQLGCSSKICSKSHGGFHSYSLPFSHCPMQNSRNAACLHWMSLLTPASHKITLNTSVAAVNTHKNHRNKIKWLFNLLTSCIVVISNWNSEINSKKGRPEAFPGPWFFSFGFVLWWSKSINCTLLMVDLTPYRQYQN